MIVSAIAAMARNGVIGKDNKLPWHIPEELKFFKDTTKGKILIMGRKTLESLPGALPNRHHIILTRAKDYVLPDRLKGKDISFAGTIDEALENARRMIQENPSYGEEVFIAGGSEVYKLSEKYWDKLYLSVINQDYEGDAYFHDWDKKAFTESHLENRIGFTIHIYSRKKL